MSTPDLRLLQPCGHAGPGPHRSGPLARAAAVQLAHAVAGRLQEGLRVSASDLFALAAHAHGGTLAEGAFSPRDAYDAAEFGLHLCLLRAGLDTQADEAGARAHLAEAGRLAALLPTQTRRTAEQEGFQQFSTPAPYAYLCAWAAGVGPGDRVIEPSAGTGALAVFALAAGATVHVNELSARRADLLSVLFAEADQDTARGGGVEGSPRRTLTRENADHLDAMLPPNLQADVVLMNPPFSQTAGRLGSRRVPTVGTTHVLQVLGRLAPGGRLVAILSAAVQRGKPTHRAFFAALGADPYRLRADVEVGGAVYRPNGTSVRTRVLVVDRRLEGSRWAGDEHVVEGGADDLEGLLVWLARLTKRAGASAAG